MDERWVRQVVEDGSLDKLRDRSSAGWPAVLRYQLTPAAAANALSCDISGARPRVRILCAWVSRARFRVVCKSLRPTHPPSGLVSGFGRLIRLQKNQSRVQEDAGCIPRGWKRYVQVASRQDQKMTRWLYLSARNMDQVDLHSIRMTPIAHRSVLLPQENLKSNEGNKKGYKLETHIVQ